MIALQHRFLLLVALMTFLWGCGRIADPDRIRIAKVDNAYITRGNLFRLINDMDDVDRPKIRSRGDLLRVLNQYIDAKIKVPLGQQLAGEGKISVPRETAREQFFRESGDDEEQYRAIWNMQPPASGEITPLMQVYNLTPEGMKAMKAMIEQKTDKVLDRMLADKAVEYLAVQGLKSGELKLDDKDMEREYKLRKDTLKKFEWMRFAAIRFPAAQDDALSQAAKIRKRLNTGESFDALAVETQSLQSTAIVRPGASASVIESEIENNPDLAKFRGFWSAASRSATRRYYRPHLPAGIPANEPGRAGPHQYRQHARRLARAEGARTSPGDRNDLG